MYLTIAIRPILPGSEAISVHVADFDTTPMKSSHMSFSGGLYRKQTGERQHEYITRLVTLALENHFYTYPKA